MPANSDSSRQPHRIRKPHRVPAGIGVGGWYRPLARSGRPGCSGPCWGHSRDTDCNRGRAASASGPGTRAASSRWAASSRCRWRCRCRWAGAVRPIATGLCLAGLGQGSVIVSRRATATRPVRPSGSACRSGDRRGGVRWRNGCAARRGLRRISEATSSA
jgi:hypothetical protein